MKALWVAGLVGTLAVGAWQDLALMPGLYCRLQPLTVRYAYAPLRSTTPATLDIDRIELTR